MTQKKHCLQSLTNRPPMHTIVGFDHQTICQKVTRQSLAVRIYAMAVREIIHLKMPPGYMESSGTDQSEIFSGMQIFRLYSV